MRPPEVGQKHIQWVDGNGKKLTKPKIVCPSVYKNGQNK